MPKNAGEKPRQLDPEANNFPSFTDAVVRLSQATTHDTEPVRRLDVRFDAGGNGVYRIWTTNDKDFEAGVIPEGVHIR